MPDLRYRTFRLKCYGHLCPADVGSVQRRRLLELIGRQDEDGMRSFFEGVVLDVHRKRAIKLLAEARALGDRLSVMDRILPALPHTEITGIYNRLRALGDELGDMEAKGVIG